MTAIRAMIAADAPAVAALLAASWRRTYGPILGEARVAASSAQLHAPERLAAEAADPSILTLVCIGPQSLPVGYAMAFGRADGEVWLERLHVAPEAFGTGVAAALLDAAIAAFPDAPAMALDVIAGNDRAVAFYRKHGFAEVASRATCGSLDDAPALILRKPLKA